MKHLLKLADWTMEEIYSVLDLADKLKKETRAGIAHPLLAGKTLAMIFEKSSTRTRASFETGMYQLGGHALFMSSKDSQLGRGEPIEDTARVLSRYVDGIMIRTFEQEKVEKLAQYGSVPVINGLTDYSHPCQVLADLQTIREYKGKLEGVKMCFIGDGINMANSLIVGGIKTGMNVSVASPAGYTPNAEIVKFAQQSGRFELTNDPLCAAKDADVVITDVWVSMGQEQEKAQREQAFKGFIVDDELMSRTANGCIVQHCLPAHRGEEITAEVFEQHANEIFDEAENRLHAQKAVMVSLMGGSIGE